MHVMEIMKDATSVAIIFKIITFSNYCKLYSLVIEYYAIFPKLSAIA